MRAKHSGKHPILVADILVHGIRELVAPVVSAVVAAAPGQHHQLLRIFHGQLPQNELMDEGEDRGIGADSKSQRKNGDGAEQRRFAQGAEGVAEVLRESGHARYTARAGKSYERTWPASVTCGRPRSSSIFASLARPVNQQ